MSQPDPVESLRCHLHCVVLAVYVEALSEGAVGQGFTAQTVASIAAFGAAYLAVLAAAKNVKQFKDSSLLQPRVFGPA